MLDGAVEVLAMLRRLGKGVFFVTNNSSKTRADYVRKLEKMGIQASLDEILCSAYATALDLHSRQVRKVHAKPRRA